MDAPHPITPTIGAGHTLLVGPGGDVSLVDLAGADPVEAERRVTALTGSGVSVAVHGVGAAAALAASEAGAMVLVAAQGGRAGLEGAAALADAGVAVELLLVEVPFGPGSMPTSAIHRVTEAGFEVVVLLPAPDPAGDTSDAMPEASGADAVDGWQIGALAQVLALGPAAVRGVTPERFRRVAAVVAAIAATDGGEAQR